MLEQVVITLAKSRFSEGVVNVDFYHPKDTLYDSLVRCKKKSLLVKLLAF